MKQYIKFFMETAELIATISFFADVVHEFSGGKINKIGAKLGAIIFILYDAYTNDVSTPEDKMPASKIEALAMKGEMVKDQLVL